MYGRRCVLALAAALAFVIPAADAAATATPIGHLVVIFDENVSFDHYFGLYPNAVNPAGEPAFTAKPGTPPFNGLSGALLTANPNGVNPFRLGRSQAVTCDNGHAYTAEQQAFDAGLMDKFVQFVSCPGNVTMGYYDGNTVTALWNYAQQYAMSDNYFETVFGPSTPGALNLIAGNTHGATPNLAGSVVNGTVIADPDPKGDQCGNRDPGSTITFGGAPNIGTLLSAKGVTWGWFQGGFRPTGSDAGGAVCNSTHANVAGQSSHDYSPHHEPFQYYDATRNPAHTPPSSAAAIGHDEPGVNHQYDLADFKTALDTGNLPAVTFLKAASFEDGHAGYSDPLDEQRFIVRTINQIQASSAWADTAIVITYDDSDGWYDHQMSPIVNSSSDPTYDQLDGAGQCHGPGAPPPAAGGYQLRCGFGPRLPLVVVSPFARSNYIDHTMIDQTSVLRFIEDNWATGRIGDSSFDDIPAGKATITPLLDFTPGAPPNPTLTLDPETGNPPVAPAPAPSPTPTAEPVITPTPAPTPVARRAPVSFTAKVKPKRDRRKPFVFKLSGKLVPPAGAKCSGRVTVSALVKRKVVGTRKVTLASSCKWALKLRFASKRKLGKGRLTLHVAYGGNASILPKTARSLRARAG